MHAAQINPAGGAAAGGALAALPAATTAAALVPAGALGESFGRVLASEARPAAAARARQSVARLQLGVPGEAKTSAGIVAQGLVKAGPAAAWPTGAAAGVASPGDPKGRSTFGVETDQPGGKAASEAASDRIELVVLPVPAVELSPNFGGGSTSEAKVVPTASTEAVPEAQADGTHGWLQLRGLSPGGVADAPAHEERRAVHAAASTVAAAIPVETKPEVAPSDEGLRTAASVTETPVAGRGMQIEPVRADSTAAEKGIEDAWREAAGAGPATVEMATQAPVPHRGAAAMLHRSAPPGPGMVHRSVSTASMPPARTDAAHADESTSGQGGSASGDPVQGSTLYPQGFPGGQEKQIASGNDKQEDEARLSTGSASALEKQMPFGNDSQLGDVEKNVGDKTIGDDKSDGEADGQGVLAGALSAIVLPGAALPGTPPPDPPVLAATESAEGAVDLRAGLKAAPRANKPGAPAPVPADESKPSRRGEADAADVPVGAPVPLADAGAASGHAGPRATAAVVPNHAAAGPAAAVDVTPALTETPPPWHAPGGAGHVVTELRTSTREPAAVGGQQVLAAGPAQLEVGILDGTHGWLKIRAELASDGTVRASLTSSASAQETLRQAVPEMSGYLASEAVKVGSIAVHRAESSDAGFDLGRGGASHGRGDGASNASARDSGQGGGDGRRQYSFGGGAGGGMERLDTGSSPPGAGFAQLAAYSGNGVGGWLNVTA